jgi:hypothetical protein
LLVPVKLGAAGDETADGAGPLLEAGGAAGAALPGLADPEQPATDRSASAPAPRAAEVR